MQENNNKSKPIQRLYIHYPFCVKLCHYCNFSAGVSPQDGLFQQYHSALLNELHQYQEQFDFSVITQNSLYFGGGTPSLMPFDFMEQLFSLIPIHNNSEITLEINPETVTKEKARFWKDLGINRVSLGWQSMNPNTLKLLGRTSTPKDNIQAFEILRNVGFDNISVDRILSVHGDTDQDFIKAITSLKPDHISTYQLSLEKNTVLDLWSKQQKYHPLPDKEALKIEAYTEDQLLNLGFHRYEISNYAQEGKEGQHNTAYWDYDYWLALGSGACGYIPNESWGTHYQNHFKFFDYCSSPDKIIELENINFQTALKDYLMLGIRKKIGISKAHLTQKFQLSWNELFPKGIDLNYFEENSTHFSLKKEAIPLCNPATLTLWKASPFLD